MKHNPVHCKCPDCQRLRQHWAHKRWEARRARAPGGSAKYDPPEDVEVRRYQQAPDDAITSVAKLQPKRTELKGFLADY